MALLIRCLLTGLVIAFVTYCVADAFENKPWCDNTASKIMASSSAIGWVLGLAVVFIGIWNIT